MKTKNLTPWCNLFSIESKYNILIGPSRYKKLFFGAVLYASTILVLSVFEQVYIEVYLVYFYLLGPRTFLSPLFVHNQYFSINNMGLCVFDNNNELQLHPSSRVSFLGCWLVFCENERACESESLNKATHLYIFKDSLSDTDFSRLARVLNMLCK